MGIIHKNDRLLDNMSSQLDRPFKCSWEKPHCSKRFNRKSDLARHYRIHTNERPYYCDFADCGKSFIQRSALTVHKRTHTGEKPHKCGHHGCDKKFSDSSSLARHRRIHNGTKPYTCPTYCGKQFCRKTTLTRHIQKCHQGEVIAEEVEFKWEDEVSESDQDVESGDDMTEQGDPDVKIELVPSAQEVKMALRPRSYNDRRDYWPLPCETAQEAHPVPYPHTPTEVMQVQMGHAQMEHQDLINHQTQMGHQIQMDRQTQIDRQAQLDHQAQVDHQARIDHQAQVDHRARIDRQAQIDHQTRIEQQAQIDQHFNQMEYIPVQAVSNDSYFQPPQMVQQVPQTAISSYLNAMTLNEQPPGYQNQFFYDDNKPLDILLPSDRMSNIYWQ